MLEDSAHIQEFEAKWKTRKAKRSGREEVFPLYTLEDAKGVQKHFVPCDYDKTIDVFEGVKIRFADAGHLLGSAALKFVFVKKIFLKKLFFRGYRKCK
jgi:metallo-beta-lactamase family protein